MPGQIKRFLNYYSRSAVRARQNLGIVLGSEREGIRKTRSKHLDLYDSYYDGDQYKNLPPWDDAHDKSGEFIPVRKRQPRIIYPFAKVICSRVASKLVGSDTFPALKVEDDPDTNEFLRMILKASKLQRKLVKVINLMCLSGSSFMRFSIINAKIILECYHSNYCYPIYSPDGTLESVKIQYVFEDEKDVDSSGNPKLKWYRMDLTAMSDTLYDNPDYNYENNPEFKMVSSIQHNLGFVQGEWFRTGEEKFSPDGPSLMADVMDFIDEMNYSLSQSSMAVGYGQEPQLTLTGVEADEIDKLIKSSSKVWNLGKDGKANFVGNDLAGVKVAMDFRDKVRLAVQDIARIVLFDPEKFAAHAQSGKAMEIMHGAMIDLINELRPFVEDSIIELVTKIAVCVLAQKEQGFETQIIIPDGYQPKSFDITTHWPPLFPLTLDDLQKKADVAIKLSASRILSEEWATGYIGPDVGVEDIEGEREKIDAQPVLNPFGGSFDNTGNAQGAQDNGQKTQNAGE